MTTIHSILNEFKQAAHSNRDLGDKFERLIANYLVIDPPLYQDKYSDAWLWNEWPDGGKLIMTCGTGKTFTSLKIAEQLTSADGTVLFLVPSISLLSQTLREWTAVTERPFHSFAVCSDIKVRKKSDNEDISVHDLAFPATTDTQKLVKQVQALPEFDLIICDEAHRTTGVTIAGANESHFVKVHDQNFIKAKKRLYMTTTPLIFSDGTKTKRKKIKPCFVH